MSISTNYVDSTATDICNSCNMVMNDSPDMYAQSPRAEGIHIRQITSAHVTTNM